MIRVRTLGQCLIEVDGERVRPDATVVFAVLLYLSAERGKRVERDGGVGESRASGAPVPAVRSAQRRSDARARRGNGADGFEVQGNRND
jgi:hypothetical protein